MRHAMFDGGVLAHAPRTARYGGARLRLGVVAAVTAIALAMPGGTVAASPHQVDPAAMTPPLNPDFGPWICTDTGGGPVCRGDVEDAWSGEDTGLRCGDAPIYTSGTYESSAARWHLPDGRAESTFFNNRATEVWTLAPDGSGPVVRIRATWNQHYVYPIPGDRPTRVMTITGAYWQALAPGGGVVFHDTGFAQFLPGSEDEVDYSHGPSDSDYNNLDLVIDDVCAVLTS